MYIGIVGSLFIIVVGIFWGGGSLGLYLDVPSVFITIGGSVFALISSFPLKNVKSLPTYFKASTRKQSYDYADLIRTLSTFADAARKEGLLSLEDKLSEVDDPFLKKGIQLAIDGLDEEVLRSTLEKDMEKMNDRHALGQDIFSQFADLAPAFGMIGTLVGLIVMLANMEDTSSIGAGMSTALITTLYGAILANGVFIPVAKKLETVHKEEVLVREMMLEGILSLVHGENVRLLKDKLISFLPKDMRAQFDEEKFD